ncbi:hypothetical protein [Pseudomonas sp. Q1]|uniref:hypothetical protein n=1 Tax=Pseudomonas sp. Q1 TaxID=2202823 RepID=UPI0013749E30|nr:hypothetical protein [Pseudomonas sp. Q1]NCE83678.1 hypothetical protein [Pseudomonas sp. Q1]
MLPSVTPDSRRLAFEARRLAIETLVKIYLEQVDASRNLVTIYLRLMFTLSLGALAGAVTLYAAMLRFSAISSLEAITLLEAICAVLTLGVLVSSAFLSARALQQSAVDAAPFLHNPFPNAGTVIDSIFQSNDLDEQQILNKLYFAINQSIEHQPALRVSARLTTALLILGLFLAGISFLV